MREFVIFAFISLIFMGCGKTKKIYYDTGELQSELYKDSKGLKQGEVINYYKNGKVKSRSMCVNDTFNGKYYEYFDNGQLKIHTTLDKGRSKFSDAPYRPFATYCIETGKSIVA